MGLPRDIDEKMFRCFTAKLMTKTSPTNLAAEIRVGVRAKSKTHIPQTIFLAAVAQPDKKNKFDGRAGIFRCARPIPAQHTSKSHPACTIEWRDYSLTAKTIKVLLKEHVIPAAVRRMSWAPVFIIQMDDARAHSSSNLVKNMKD